MWCLSYTYNTKTTILVESGLIAMRIVVYIIDFALVLILVFRFSPSFWVQKAAGGAKKLQGHQKNR